VLTVDGKDVTTRKIPGTIPFLPPQTNVRWRREEVCRGGQSTLNENTQTEVMQP
jgi:hypothetical protein